MSKYNYDRSVLSGLSVGAFLNETKVREEHISKGENTIPTSVYNPNRLAAKLHPGVQFGVVKEVRAYDGAKSFLIGPDAGSGCTELAYFRAGQYISIALNIGDAAITRPYSLSSAPKAALGEKDNTYMITVKEKEDGFAAKHILENWNAGTKIMMSGPLGQFYYEGLRDSKNVIAIAGGSGITPFYSMAQAIADGTEDFELTILYGSRSHENILLKSELSDCEARAKGKVKVIHVLSDDDAEGFEHGFITAELIKKYAPASDDYSVFVCGPKAMYRFAEGETAKLGLPKRRVRFELSGEYGDPTKDEAYPKEFADKEFNVKVLIHGEYKELKCKADNSLLRAMEAAGLHVPTDCRSGKCGWCHSRLISGDVYIPESADGRRLADKKFGWIHPCSAFPLSDIELEIFPNY